MGVAGIERSGLTLGILAGGRATRLGGLDKAWLRHGGVPQVVRLQAALADHVAHVIVAANAAHDRYSAAGMRAVADRVAGAGPLGGLDALAQACRTPWLFTVPVDAVDVDAGVLHTLAASAGEHGARACDADGPQPLVAVWQVECLRAACADALRAGRHSVQELQVSLRMASVRFDGIRFGNLNTPADLAAAGIRPGSDAD